MIDQAVDQNEPSSACQNADIKRHILEAGPLRPDDPSLLNRCRNALADHRKRAKKAGQAITYTVQDLAAIAAKASTCCYCGDPLTPASLAFDHAIPTARTASPATFGLGNLRACCTGCNLAKGSLLEGEWRQLLALLRTFTPRSGADVLLRLRHGGRRYARRRS